MKAVRTIFAALIALGFVMSSALSHAHPMPTAQSHAMHHGADADHAHHHAAATSDGQQHASHDADLPHCCSMGACGFLSPAAPLLMLKRVEVSLDIPAAPTTRSVSAVPEAPPPRTNG